MTIRPLLFLIPAGLFLVPAAGRLLASDEPPLPWTLQIEVAWGKDHNREIYREDLQALLLQELIAGDCYRAIVIEPPADLTLRVTLETLDISEEREFRGPPAGGAGEMVSKGAAVTVAGRIELVAAGGKPVRETHRFRRVVRADPRSTTDEPLSRALLQAWNEPVRWAARMACGHRDRLRGEAAKAGIPAPPAQP